MPLSEHEQRVLAEIERGLYEDDPRFATTVRTGSVPSGDGRRLRWALAGFLVGVACLLALTFSLVLGLVGFGLMLVSLIVAASALRGVGARQARNLKDHVREAFDRRGSDSD